LSSLKDHNCPRLMTLDLLYRLKVLIEYHKFF